MSQLQKLYKTLEQRKRPEDVAQMVEDILGDQLNVKEREVLTKATKRSLRNSFYGYTSMYQEFSTAVGAKGQITKAEELFKLINKPTFDYNNVDHIQYFINKVSPLIHKGVGENNFISDRLNKAERAESGLVLSKRAYNKRWRLLKRLEKKLIRYTEEIKKVEFQKIGKHGLSHRIEYEEFIEDLNSACFIAYYNARCNLRSKFTNGRQERAFDEISEMLLNRCKEGSTKSNFDLKEGKTMSSTNWSAISYVYISQEVLMNLSEIEKGKLLGLWTNILQEVAEYLQKLWRNNKINRKNMIVRAGNDSTTWNNTAGAWNKARDNWMNLIYALGMEYVLDDICFGKVLRLMAGDVVYWHRTSGGNLDPNTEVWNKIPLPWEVFQGKASCNKSMIEKYCKEARIHPRNSGWIAPRRHKVEKFKPTPELVHGVSISNPYFATILKKQKFYSGKV